jgi:hypothetical protein
MNLVLIDNSFYKLTPQQAKQLAVENTLPKHGYERKADLAKLASVNFGRLERFEVGINVKARFQKFEHCKPEQVKAAWVTRTPLSYWQGKPIENNWTWALHVVWN